MKKITIVDYGSGNVLSAQKSFIKIAKDNNIEVDVLISKKLNDVKNSTHIVLPGQGAFSTCMNGLKKTDGLIDELCEFALIKKKPFLGICVGMQILADQGYENQKTKQASQDRQARGECVYRNLEHHRRRHTASGHNHR